VWWRCGHDSTRDSGKRVPLFEPWQLEPMPMYAAFPPNRHVSATLRVFVDRVAGLMAQHAPVANRQRGGQGSRDTRKATST